MEWTNTKPNISIHFSTKKISLGALLQSLERYTVLIIDKAANLFNSRSADEDRKKFYVQLFKCIFAIRQYPENLGLFEREIEAHPYLEV